MSYRVRPMSWSVRSFKFDKIRRVLRVRFQTKKDWITDPAVTMVLCNIAGRAELVWLIRVKAIGKFLKCGRSVSSGSFKDLA